MEEDRGGFRIVLTVFKKLVHAYVCVFDVGRSLVIGCRKNRSSKWKFRVGEPSGS